MSNINQGHLDIIMRQTTYSQEEALMHYTNNGKDYIKTIKEYMNIKEVTNSNCIQKSINQEIYKAMREQLEIHEDKRDLISNKKIVASSK
jgi:lysine/ornithine N-monooxygenase